MTYAKPGSGTRILATAMRFVPKIGTFKGLGFNNPAARTEGLDIESINTATDSYRALLEEVRAGTLVLPNFNLDDGSKTRVTEYSLADETYASLLARLSAGKFNQSSRNCAITFSLFIPIWRCRSIPGKMHDAGKECLLI